MNAIAKHPPKYNLNSTILDPRLILSFSIAFPTTIFFYQFIYPKTIR